jgi:hypothetical protein
MIGGTASWHFLDVESGQVPEGARSSVLPRSGDGRIVVLGATPLARAGGWAGRAAVSIATAWAREGRRIFLMDLGLESPSLHEILELPNEEGVSDAFLYGASVQRIARSTLDGEIFFAPAGTATADPEDVLRHPRWHDLAGGFSETDATLLLFLPTEIPGADSILKLGTDVVFLAAQGESADALLGAASVKLVVTLGPLASPQEVAGEPSYPGEPPAGKAPPASGYPGGQETWEQEEGGALGGDKALAPDEEALSSRFHLAEGFLPESTDEEKGTPDVAPESTLVHSGQSSTWRTGSGPLDVPDFGAEFADLPPLEDEEVHSGGAPGAGEEGGGFGQDLVSGPDFGAFTPEDRSSEGRPDAPARERGVVSEKGEDGPAERVPPPTPPRSMPRRRPPPPRKRPIGSLVAVVLALAAVAVIVGTVLGVFTLPGFGFLPGFQRDLPEPSLALPGPQPNEPLLRYSLEVFRYTEEELSFAVELQSELRARLPDLLFVLAPADSRSGVTYVLLAGPAETLIDVENVRAALAGVITREIPESWRVRETPRAFFLGERGTLQEAREFVASLEDSGIFGYVLHATFPGGTDAYLVLAGAYEGVADARRLQSILRQAGVGDAPLIERRGRFPG